MMCGGLETSNLTFQKGSTLVFSLLLLSMLLVSGLAIVASSVADHKSAIATTRSSLAFQNAESGIEDVLDQFKTNGSVPPFPLSTSTLTEVFGGDCESGGIYDHNDGYQVFFYSSTSWDPSHPNDNRLDCNKTIGEIKLIRSVGTYEGASRAIAVPYN